MKQEKIIKDWLFSRENILYAIKNLKDSKWNYDLKPYTPIYTKELEDYYRNIYKENFDKHCFIVWKI